MTLTLLGKPDCHLCHVMEEEIAPLLAERGVRLEVRDVREDPELLRRYRFEIPVLLADGVELARHRITRDELAAQLDGLTESHGVTEARRKEGPD